MMQCFTSEIVASVTGLPPRFVDTTMRGMSMYDHEVVIACTLYWKCPSPDKGRWLGCCVVSCKLHDEDDVLDLQTFAELLETSASTLKSAEADVLRALDWRLPIDKSAYLTTYKRLLKEPRRSTCTPSCLHLIFASNPPKV